MGYKGYHKTKRVNLTVVIPKDRQKWQMCENNQSPAKHQEEILLRAKEEVLIWRSFQSNILIIKKTLLPFSLVRIKMF